MHLVMISLALAIAITIRRSDILTQGTWQQRWERSLFCFLFPPPAATGDSLCRSLHGAWGTNARLFCGMAELWHCDRLFNNDPRSVSHPGVSSLANPAPTATASANSSPSLSGPFNRQSTAI
ncbi:MAG: hypothetical protein LRZ84_27620 [Desertifilum sp.]|nr:hypothetical protein [Desertifilum sp.]